MFWNYCADEIKRGFAEKEDRYVCIFCEADFEKGRIYQIGEEYFDAFGAVKYHVESEHGGAQQFLLSQESGVTGLSEIHKSLISLLFLDKTDKEISEALGIAPSTVRSHKFRLREKEKQAKVFLAIMALLEDRAGKSVGRNDIGTLEELHSSAKMVDDRYNITDSERKKTISSYMDKNGKLKQFPAKEKKKIIILREITNNFKRGAGYTEKEVDRILKRIYEEDYATLRRALIEYGFMDRAADGSRYRVKE